MKRRTRQNPMATLADVIPAIADDSAAARAAIGASESGDVVFTGSPSQALMALEVSESGSAVFTGTPADALAAIGASPVARPKILPASKRLERQFDPRLSLYNANSGNGLVAKAGLARTHTLPRLLRIACKGDSITQGVSYLTHRQADSYPSQLRDKLKALGYRCAGDGFVIPNGYVTGMTDTRWSTTGTWTTAYESSNYLWGIRSVGVATISFTTREPCTRLAVHWFNGIGGNCTVAIDGVAAANINVVGGNTIGVQEYANLTDAQHTITITTTGTFVLHGIDCTSSNGFVVDNFGRSGASTINWLPTDSTPYPTWRNHDTLAKRLQVSDNNQLNVTVLQLGTNDAFRALPPTSNGVEPADYLANLETIIESSAAVSEVMLVAPYQLGDYRDDVAGMAPYNAAIYQLADEYNLRVLDMADRWQDYTTARNMTRFISDDNLHPSVEGYFDYAEGVAGMLGASPAKSAKANSAKAVTELIGWTYDPATQVQSSILPAAATRYFHKIPITERHVVINVVLNLAAVGSDLSNAFVALYKSDGTVLRQSADQSSVWGAGGSTGLKVIPLTSSTALAPEMADDFVWAVIYVGSATTLPTFSRGVGAGSAFINVGTTPTRRRFGQVALANTDTLTSVDPAAMALASNAYFIGIS